jgi:F-type H+-transporting ATPase subunit delta
MVSRTKAAEYLANQLISGNREEAIASVAYLLKDNGKINELPYLIKDATNYLAINNGYYFVVVTTAKPLGGDQQMQISDSIKQKYEINEIETLFLVDESLIGGIKIEFPNGVLDASVRGKLNKLIENIV